MGQWLTIVLSATTGFTDGFTDNRFDLSGNCFLPGTVIGRWDDAKITVF